MIVALSIFPTASCSDGQEFDIHHCLLYGRVIHRASCKRYFVTFYALTVHIYKFQRTMLASIGYITPKRSRGVCNHGSGGYIGCISSE